MYEPVASPALLGVNQLVVQYGHVEALRGIALQVNQGELVALVGANGAGKSSLLMALSGLASVQQGQLWFNGNNITQWPAHRRVKEGLIQVAEGRAILKTLTVEDNLRLGGYAQATGVEPNEIYQRFPILKKRARQLAGNLSGGEQQMLAIGRALLAKPRLLMLDEPSMGLAPLIIREIFAIVHDLHQQGMTLLLVEQNVRQALKLANRAYVLETGTITLSGPAEELTNHPGVLAAYLGG